MQKTLFRGLLVDALVLCVMATLGGCGDDLVMVTNGCLSRYSMVVMFMLG